MQKSKKNKTMNTENLKVGDVLIAIDECKMTDSKEKALIIGKEYPIIKTSDTHFYINSEFDDNHMFSFDEYQDIFKLKEHPTEKDIDILHRIIGGEKCKFDDNSNNLIKLENDTYEMHFLFDVGSNSFVGIDIFKKIYQVVETKYIAAFKK